MRLQHLYTQSRKAKAEAKTEAKRKARSGAKAGADAKASKITRARKEEKARVEIGAVKVTPGTAAVSTADADDNNASLKRRVMKAEKLQRQHAAFVRSAMKRRPK